MGRHIYSAITLYYKVKISVETTQKASETWL
jgi:hypothetical protein